MIPLYRSGELRKIESLASSDPLMERAGAAAAELAAQIADPRGAAILILAGPGNNGGDAFVTARLLREGFFDVRVVFIGSPDKLPGDAADAFRRFVDAGGVYLSEIPEKLRWSLIVDGVFGIGLKREISGAYADLIHRANALAKRDACPLLALDCPSGLDADTGAQRGPTVAATHTISFIAHKPGLFTLDGPDRCGRVLLAPLGIDAASLVAPPGELVAPEAFSATLKPRLHNTHKGNYGSVGVLGGSDGMVGAAWLTARAALKLGAGRVYLGLLA
ncbi:MAG: NAD(P)H-hydrate epimerase, partial [Candidatus Accumulibacter sp.]|nr:NAD(P)H-hydrate epimerase [Accumulibacter sp.]